MRLILRVIVLVKWGRPPTQMSGLKKFWYVVLPSLHEKKLGKLRIGMAGPQLKGRRVLTVLVCNRKDGSSQLVVQMTSCISAL